MRVRSIILGSVFSVAFQDACSASRPIIHALTRVSQTMQQVARAAPARSVQGAGDAAHKFVSGYIALVWMGAALAYYAACENNTIELLIDECILLQSATCNLLVRYIMADTPDAKYHIECELLRTWEQYTLAYRALKQQLRVCRTRLERARTCYRLFKKSESVSSDEHEHDYFIRPKAEEIATLQEECILLEQAAREQKQARAVLRWHAHERGIVVHS